MRRVPSTEYVSWLSSTILGAGVDVADRQRYTKAQAGRRVQESFPWY